MSVNRKKMLDIFIESGAVAFKADIITCIEDNNLQTMVEKLFTKGENDFGVVSILKKYYESIDMEKLFLYSIKKGEEFIDRYEKMSEFEREQLKSDGINENAVRQEKEGVKKLKTYFKGKKIWMIHEKISLAENKIIMDVLDTDVLIEGIKNAGSKKYKKFEEFLNAIDKIKIKQSIEKGQETKEVTISGKDMFFSSIPELELINIYPTDEMALSLYTYSRDKALLYDLKKDINDLITLKQTDNKLNKILNDDEYEDFEDYVYDRVLETAGEFKKYADFDKLVMSGAYYLEHTMEKYKLSTEEVVAIKGILENALEYCEKNMISDRYSFKKIKNVDDYQERETVKYSPKNIKECLSRYNGDEYVKKQDIDGLKEKVNDGEILLHELDKELLSFIYSKDELISLLFSNEENYEFIKKRLNLDILKDKDTIINLAKKQGLDNPFVLNKLLDENLMTMDDILQRYNNGKIDDETLKQIIANRDVESIIDFQELRYKYESSLYMNSKKDEYEKYLNLCKLVGTYGGEKKDDANEPSEFSEKFMENFALNYDEDKRDEYIRHLENFYKEGLLDIRSIISWEDDSIVSQFIKDKVFTYKDLLQMQEEAKERTGKGIVDDEYFIGVYAQCILDRDFDSKKRMEELKGNIKIPEDYIARAYIDGILSTEEIDKLIELEIVSKNQPLIKEKKHEEFLKQVAKVFDIDEDDLNEIPNLDFSNIRKKRRKSVINPNPSYVNAKDIKTIIHPEIREEYISLFKGVDYTDKAKIKEGNPFYNYRFYVLPDEDGRLGENSVIIAERFYADKENPDKYSTGDATYCYRCKDFISDMTKKDFNAQSEKTAYTAIHRICSDKRAGSWAKNVYYNIAKVMLSDKKDELEEAKGSQKVKMIEEKMKEVYTEAELEGIKKLMEEIDTGVYNIDYCNCDYDYPSL